MLQTVAALIERRCGGRQDYRFYVQYKVLFETGHAFEIPARSANK